MDSYNSCPIWGTTAQVSRHASDGVYDEYHVISKRAGGQYIITEVAAVRVKSLEDSVKARLTSMLISRRDLGEEHPTVRADNIDAAETLRALPIHERADRLLRYLVSRSIHIGVPTLLRYDDPEGLAVSESTSADELASFIKYFQENHWIASTGNNSELSKFRITVHGYNRTEDLITSIKPAQGFIAMWIDDLKNETYQPVDKAYRFGIVRAIKMSGYDHLRIDKKLSVQKIDDEIIAEIRRSHFVVADFTHGKGGIRGGVYYEAGFAEGFGIPVIYTCRKDQIKKLHFDTRQYYHIAWETPDQLYKELRERIIARIGMGPNQIDEGDCLESSSLEEPA